jgi:hypothetical protein
MEMTESFIFWDVTLYSHANVASIFRVETAVCFMLVFACHILEP